MRDACRRWQAPDAGCGRAQAHRLDAQAHGAPRAEAAIAQELATLQMRHAALALDHAQIHLSTSTPRFHGMAGRKAAEATIIAKWKPSWEKRRLAFLLPEAHRMGIFRRACFFYKATRRID